MTNEMKADLVVVAFIIAALSFIGGAEYQKAHDPTKAEVIRDLSYDDRQTIAVQFMCTERNWKGVETFCGSQVFDSDNKETTK